MKRAGKPFAPVWRRPKRRTPWGALRRPRGHGLFVEIFDETQGVWPIIEINAPAHGKIRALAAACAIEVTWLSPIVVKPNGNVVITDVFVPGQICNSRYTEMTRDGEAALQSELTQSGAQETLKHLLCWGHSHTSGPVFASPLDEETTDRLIADARAMKKTHFVRLVVNVWDDLFASLYRLDEGRAYHHVPLRVAPPETECWRAWAQREVLSKVILIPEPKTDEEFLGYVGGHTFVSAAPTVVQIGAKRKGGRK